MRCVAGVLSVVWAIAVGAACGADVDAGVDVDVGADVDVDGDGDGDGDAGAGAGADVDGDGAIGVGYRTELVTYVPDDGSGPRTLRVAFWYPTRAVSGDEALYYDLFAAPGVFALAPPARDLGPLPVVVFSHGNSGFAEQSWFLTESLARAGYLVVAPDHTGNTPGATPPPAIFHWRPSDLSAVLDHLAALPADDLLTGLASDRIAVAGHSFGGYTALAIGGAAWDVDGVLAWCVDHSLVLDGCAALAAEEARYRAGFLDPRVDAIVPMAPGATQVFGASGLAAVALPTLLITGAMDRTTPNAVDGDPSWAALAARSPDNVRVDFASAGHFTFSNVCDLPVGLGADDGCGPDFIPPARAHAVIDAYAKAFLDLHLRGDDAGRDLLEGRVALDPDVTLSRGAGAR